MTTEHPFTSRLAGLLGTAVDRTRAAARSAAPAKSRTDPVSAAIAGVLAEFSVNAAVEGRLDGPTVATHLIRPAAGVKVAAVRRLEPNIALKLGTEQIRVLPVVAGRPGVMGVEVPLARRVPVGLPDLLVDLPRQGRLLVPFGRGTAGAPVVVDLAELPHLLVAGETGGGKSGVLNAIICSLLSRNTPRGLGLLLVDPKRVELSAYRTVPHLVTPIVTNPKKAADALDWLVGEMEDRYERLEAAGVRNIGEYNRAAARDERLRYLVAVVDELADLMMVAPKDVEGSVVRLTQLARAAGIHVVLATQRPSVDVVTGLIKANMPARLALRTSSMVDSRVILDEPGAEKLLGKGDALLRAPGTSGATRLQCALVTRGEIAEVVAAAETFGPPRQATPPAADRTAPAAPAVAAATVIPTDPPGGSDLELLVQAIELVVTSQFGSTSMLQRKLRVGFAKAGRLMDLMEPLGVVGPPNGSKARDVLIKADELPEVLQRLRGVV
ncbi:DNA translocase FtsK [Dactylosporangium roseum]|uniref:DNA translocase FtsK n=1 Tax=Dactylosporangium roseum TaxID=47989 RepID=A0ABY5Z721_9ACTN|nr:DNA translocase FtsK [Dactylosporangium roseum]UWZ37459.1 DNA translocase FtsK [Dactylosporangium roseum]